MTVILISQTVRAGYHNKPMPKQPIPMIKPTLPGTVPGVGPLAPSSLPGTTPGYTPPETVPGKVLSFGGDVLKGIAKGAAGTVSGLMKLGQNTDAFLSKNIGAEPFPTNPQYKALQDYITEKSQTHNIPQSIGAGIENIGEFFIPVTKAGSLGKLGSIGENIAAKGVANLLPDLSNAGRVARFMGGAADTASRALVQSGLSGAVQFEKTGGDINSAENAAIGGTLFRGALGAVGSTLRAFHIPEFLMSQIFKTNKSEMLDVFTNKINPLELKATNPELFNSYVTDGIIKKVEGGFVVNEPLAEEALRRGMKGSLDTMAQLTNNTIQRSEQGILDAVRAKGNTLFAIDPRIKDTLKDIYDTYKQIDLGKISGPVGKILQELEDNGGSMTAESLLKARRVLDSLRMASSFQNSNTPLSMQQLSLAEKSEALRKQINRAVPEARKFLDDYHFGMEAMKALVQKAVGERNRPVLTQLESFLLGGGMFLRNVGAGGLGALTAHITKNPQALTYAAQGLENPTAGPALTSAIGLTADALTKPKEQEALPLRKPIPMNVPLEKKMLSVPANDKGIHEGAPRVSYDVDTATKAIRDAKGTGIESIAKLTDIEQKINNSNISKDDMITLLKKLQDAKLEVWKTLTPMEQLQLIKPGPIKPQ